MAHYILDKAYTVTEADGVDACRIVVQGTSAGEAALPSASNPASILGVTVHAQPNVNRTVAVRKAGIARVIAAGAIDAGAAVNSSDDGKAKAIDETTGTKVNCLGFAETAASAAGDIIEVFISLHQRTA